MQKFKQAAKEKFDRGAQEHQRPWNAESIEWKKELSGEMIDTYWYLDFAPFYLKYPIRLCAIALWYILQ